MHFGRPDQVPIFEEGIRDDVLETWQAQGMPSGITFSEMFPSDGREEILPDLEPQPYPKTWPTSRAELADLRQRLDPNDPGRLPAGWPELVRDWRAHGDVLMLRVHQGFFETMGVSGWRSFDRVVCLLIEDPPFVHELMNLQGAFAARMAERVLQEVDIDAAIFSEPIADNNGPLISPRMYEEFALPSYEPIFEVLRRHGVETIILRTYANARALLPAILKHGFNCLWACEVNPEAMDYHAIRREFGRELRLIGGIDVDALKDDKENIKREVEEKIPPLLADGGYVPLADGRIRADVPFENYVYYRQLLEEVIKASPIYDAASTR